MKNHSIFTKEGYITFIKSMGNKTMMQTVIIDCAAILIAVLAYFEKMLWLSIVIICVAVFFSILNPLYLKYKINKLVNDAQDMYDKAIYDFDFSEDGFHLTYTYEEEKTEKDLNYSDLFKVIETKKYIMLMVTFGMAYIVDKNGFDNPDDIQKLIGNLKLKAKNYIYKEK